MGRFTTFLVRCRWTWRWIWANPWVSVGPQNWRLWRSFLPRIGCLCVFPLNMQKLMVVKDMVICITIISQLLLLFIIEFSMRFEMSDSSDIWLWYVIDCCSISTVHPRPQNNEFKLLEVIVVNGNHCHSKKWVCQIATHLLLPFVICACSKNEFQLGFS